MTEKANLKARFNSVRHLTFKEIIRSTGRKKTDLFYVIDWTEIMNALSLSRPYRTDDYSIVVIKKGTLTIKQNIVEYVLSTGSVFTKGPRSIFQIINMSNDCEFKILGFTQNFLSASGIHKKHLEAFGFLSGRNGPHLVLGAAETANVWQLLMLLQQKSRTKGTELFYQETVQHAFSLLAFQIASLYNSEQDASAMRLTRKEYLTVQFLKILPDHFKEYRTVSYYADRLNLSPKHLSKCIKEVTGKTCGEIIDEMVIMEAKVLLDDPSFSIAQVADQLNFSDQFFFSKYFKSHTGSTPSSYRTSF